MLARRDPHYHGFWRPFYARVLASSAPAVDGQIRPVISLFGYLVMEDNLQDLASPSRSTLSAGLFHSPPAVVEG
jgi:hypothetical protein